MVLHVAKVWACVAKRRHWLGEEMYGVWSGKFQTKRKTKEDLERGCAKDCQACKLNRENATEEADKGLLFWVKGHKTVVVVWLTVYAVNCHDFLPSCKQIHYIGSAMA